MDVWVFFGCKQQMFLRHKSNTLILIWKLPVAFSQALQLETASHSPCSLGLASITPSCRMATYTPGPSYSCSAPTGKASYPHPFPHVARFPWSLILSWMVSSSRNPFRTLRLGQALSFLGAVQHDPSCSSGSNQQRLGECLYLLPRTGSSVSSEAGLSTTASLDLIHCFSYTNTKIALTIVISCLS